MENNKIKLSIDRKIEIILKQLIKNTEYFENDVNIDYSSIEKYFEDRKEIDDILCALARDGYVIGDYAITLKGINYYTFLEMKSLFHFYFNSDCAR